MAKVTNEKIVIDASSRVFYASYYIEGLYRVFGKKNVSFAGKGFSGLERRSEAFAFEHYFAFPHITGDGSATRYVVDFCDPPDINPSAYRWCDVYGKLNFNPGMTDPAHLGKIKPLPPAFGIRVWNACETVRHAFANFLRCGMRPLKPKKEYFRDYYIAFLRPRLSAYFRLRGKSQRNYIFLVSTLWPDDDETNRQRKLFLETAKATGLEVEGGFIAQRDHRLYERYRDWVVARPFSAVEFIGNMARSAFVFSTDAVHNCLGWKLGEYLALGKAILSTPVSNTMVPALEHGRHVFFAKDGGALSDAVRTLASDDQLRQTLEAGAAEYFDRYASPEAVIRNLTARK